MINTNYAFIGSSNVYVCDSTLEEYKNHRSKTCWIHSDTFMDKLDMALNPKQARSSEAP